MTKIWEVWKPWKPEENLYTSYKKVYDALDEVLEDPSSSLDKLQGKQIVKLYDANLLMIQDFALFNIQEQIARPSERIKYASKDEVLGILSWPYHHSGQRIDQLKPQIVDIYSDFYDTCHGARSKILNQMEEDSKNPETDPNKIPYPIVLCGGLATGSGAGYISGNIAEALVIGLVMAGVIWSGSTIASRSAYKKKQVAHFQSLIVEDKEKALVELLDETIKIIKGIK